MAYDKPLLQTSDPYKKVSYDKNNYRNIYYGEVMSINDPTDGGIIKVKILGLDNKITETSDLANCYPLLPKFFHIYPKVGEVVRIFIEDINFPQRGRFWLGSIISQPQKFEYDSIYTALSTTNMALTKPDKAPSTFPNSDGVFPEKTDVALIGRENTDIILSENKVELRSGKHVNGDVLNLNIQNPATISLNFEQKDGEEEYHSNTIIKSNKIALITHDGNPKFKAARENSTDRERIFEEAHPMVRGDVLLNILEIFRKSIIQHIHGYSGLPADKNSIINNLEKIDLQTMIQENIVIN